MSHPSRSRQHARHSQRNAPHFVVHRIRHLQRRHEHEAQCERARIVASLIAASQALAADPDAAVLLLDGALAHLLDLWAQQARLPASDRRQALAALDAQAPALAWRVRLALQAHQPEARLAHCWALLELLTLSTTTRRQHHHYAPVAPLSRTAGEGLGVGAVPANHLVDHNHSRTNGASHVS
jgi:hypothetical protein